MSLWCCRPLRAAPWLSTIAGSLVLFCCAPTPLVAQRTTSASQSLGNGSSLNSNQGAIGIGSGAGITAGTRTLTGSGTSTQSGASAASGQGSSGLGTQVGQTTGAERYLRSNRTADQFVGADTQEAGTFVGNVQAGPGNTGSRARNAMATAGRETMGRQTAGRGNQAFGNFGNNGGFGNNSRNNASRAIFRTQLKVGFVPPPVNTTRQTADVQSRLARVSRLQQMNTPTPIQVSVEGGTYVLSGTVATDEQRAVLERMVRLEPGIRQVENRLQVAGSGS